MLGCFLEGCFPVSLQDLLLECTLVSIFCQNEISHAVAIELVFQSLTFLDESAGLSTAARENGLLAM